MTNDLKHNISAEFISTDKIDDKVYHIRDFKPNAPDIKELAESIEANGLINPILVNKVSDNKYELICGHRRFAAIKYLKLPTVKAQVVAVGMEEAKKMAIVENLQREDLDPISESIQMCELYERVNSIEELARVMGKSPKWVMQRLRLKDLIPKWKKAFESKLSNWTAAHLEVIAGHKLEIQEILYVNLIEYYDDANGYTLKELKERCQNKDMQMQSAPFDKYDPDLVPEAGACNKCPKRTLRIEDLFSSDTNNQVDKTDQCMDRECWNKKIEAYNVQLYGKLCEEFGNDKFYVMGWKKPAFVAGSPFVEKWEAKECKKSAKNAVPALILTDDRSVARRGWIEKPKNLSEKNTKLQLPEEIRENRLEGRRAAWMVQETKKRMSNSIAPPKPSESSDLAHIANLAVIFGTEHRADGRAPISWKELAKGNNETVEMDLWLKIKPVLIRRLFHGTNEDALQHTMPEVVSIHNLMGWDIDELKRAAEKAVPTPKSWAKKEVPETAKKKTVGKKSKSNKTK